MGDVCGALPPLTKYDSWGGMGGGCGYQCLKSPMDVAAAVDVQEAAAYFFGLLYYFNFLGCNLSW